MAAVAVCVNFRGRGFPPPRALPPFPRACIHAHTHIQLQLTSDVENFPGYAEAVSGPDLMEDLRKQAEVSYVRRRRARCSRARFFLGGATLPLAGSVRTNFVSRETKVCRRCSSCPGLLCFLLEQKRSRPKCLPALNKRKLLCSFPAAALRHRDDVPGRDLGGPFRKTVPGFGAEAGLFCQVRDPARGKSMFRFAILLYSRARVHAYTYTAKLRTAVLRICCRPVLFCFS